jgi:glucosamine--fructose-6-phosphate aminotransferase (isomerizing)
VCGIVGFVGSARAATHVLEGLRRLEYRGYDSAGIATVHGGQIHVRRRRGKLAMLAGLLGEEPLCGSIAIGHTRWATHGRPSDENAHPHQADDIVLVHNGIIENFLELRAEIVAQGRKLQSETDTEIIAHLIALAAGDDLQTRVRGALQRLRGAYALVVLSTRQPDTLVVAKNASPLILGVAEHSTLVASDIPALLDHTRDVVVLEEGEMAVLTSAGYALSSLQGTPIARAPRRIDWSPVQAEKEGHRHFMHKEMHEQPRALADTMRGRIGIGDDLVRLDESAVAAVAAAQRIVLTACGTSYHAGLVARLALEELARVGCEVELASELRYRSPLMGPGTLLLAISQSGETADTLAAISAAKAAGSPVLSVVNVVDSSIARASDHVLYTHAGPEIGVASTKAFVTQVALLHLLAIAAGLRRGLAFGRAAEWVEGLRRIPVQVEAILQQEGALQRAAQRFVRARSALFLGRGYGYPIALEGALKLKEISYIHAEGYAAGEMKHGPIALVEPDVPCVFIATQSPVYDKVVSNLQEVRAREGRVFALATEGDRALASLCEEVFYVPRTANFLSPLLCAVPLQLLAYHVADLRGTDIDQPRNLAKSVTVE